MNTRIEDDIDSEIYELSVENTTSGYQDNNVAMIVSEFNYVESFKNELILVLIGKNYYFITGDSTLIPCIYSSWKEVSWWEEVSSHVLAVKNEKWGLVDSRGLECTPCVYDHIGYFRKGYAKVKRDGKWGYLDELGKEIVECKYNYEELHRHHPDTSFRRSEELDRRYGRIEAFHQGLAAVSREGWNGKWGFINRRGKEVIPRIYQEAGHFSDGLAPVYLHKWFYIDKTGATVLSFRCKEAYSFNEGRARIAIKDKYGFIDKHGRKIIPCIYDDACDFDGGLAAVSLGGKWGFIDKKGKVIIDIKYQIRDDERGFRNDRCLVQYEGNTLFIDKKGNEIAKLPGSLYGQWLNPKGLWGTHTDNLIIAENEDWKWGFVNSEGDVIVPYIYTELTGFYKGYAQAKLGGKARKTDNDGGKWGWINEQGEVVIPCIYDKVWTLIPPGFFAVRKPGSELWNIVDWKNNIMEFRLMNKSVLEGEIVINQVHYKLCPDGTAEAFSLIDGYEENLIEHMENPDKWISLTIPACITALNGSTYIVDKFTIPELSYIKALDLPSCIKSVKGAFSDTGTYFSSMCKINLNDNPNIILEDLIFYNSDKTVILNANLLTPKGDYVIPEGVVEVEDYAYHMAELMETITFPTTIRKIGYAFGECTFLTTVYIKADPSNVQIYKDDKLCAFPSGVKIKFIGNQEDYAEDKGLTISEQFAVLALHMAKLDWHVKQEEIDKIISIAKSNNFLDEDEVINLMVLDKQGQIDYDVDDVMWAVQEKYYPYMFIALVLVAFSDFKYTRAKQHVIKTLMNAWELADEWCNETILKTAEKWESGYKRKIVWECNFALEEKCNTQQFGSNQLNSPNTLTEDNAVSGEDFGDSIQIQDVPLPDGRIMTVSITIDEEGKKIVGKYTREIKDGIRSYIVIDGLASDEIEEFSDAFRNVMKEDKKAYAAYLWEELGLDFDHKRLGDIVISVEDIMDDAIILSQVATADAPYGSIYRELEHHFEDAKVFFLAWADGPQRPDRLGGPWAYDKMEYYDEAGVLTLKYDCIFSNDPVLVYYTDKSGTKVTALMDRKDAEEKLRTTDAEIIKFKRCDSIRNLWSNELFG